MYAMWGACSAACLAYCVMRRPLPTKGLLANMAVVAPHLGGWFIGLTAFHGFRHTFLRTDMEKDRDERIRRSREILFDERKFYSSVPLNEFIDAYGEDVETFKSVKDIRTAIATLDTPIPRPVVVGDSQLPYLVPLYLYLCNEICGWHSAEVSSLFPLSDFYDEIGYISPGGLSSVWEEAECYPIAFSDALSPTMIDWVKALYEKRPPFLLSIKVNYNPYEELNPLKEGERFHSMLKTLRDDAKYSKTRFKRFVIYVHAQKVRYPSDAEK